ncbi:heparan-alpha-glucosaminide N-acetyltransferase domain-containing protein [Actinomyces wuliandei]|uniref:heparan-alpha-glucosaminide N-acetyltransferase domain-containing protein n=1 Tax=Actinomyces wuliandei TaxID=2057743 RepID=UPI000FDA1FEB|nr:heparan-alpha-glucosaminide N-acetyltransferase domain-containing protein [Actinomyces wuliandei]
MTDAPPAPPAPESPAHDDGGSPQRPGPANPAYWAGPAGSDTSATPSPRDTAYYSWRLPRRQGAYLTGTAGPNRLTGLDAARGLALIGMMAAHAAFTTCGLTTLPGLLNQSHGRSSILFATIAGFSLGLMSGGRNPHRGERLVRTRLRLMVRSAMLLVLAAVMSWLGTPVAIILGFYAAWLVLGIPFLRVRPSRLFLLAGACALTGGVVSVGLPALAQELGLTLHPPMGDGNNAVTDFFVTGTYPGVVWMAFIFLGLGLSRLDWSRGANLRRLAGAGLLCAVIGYGSGWALSQVVNPEFPETFHLVSPADPAECFSASELSSSLVVNDPGSSLPAGSNSWKDAVPDGPEGSGIPEPGTADSSVLSKGALSTEPTISLPELRYLATTEPHSGSPFEVIGSAGVAMVVIAVAQLVARRARYLLAPLAAAGSMSLTVYCGHLVVFWMLRSTSLAYGESNLLWASMAAGACAFAMAWFAVFARGPLEHLVHVVSVRATRARG